MKRIVVFSIIVGLFSVLSGCQTDHKQAAEIHKKVEESASFEEKFVVNQQDLDGNRKKVQEIYLDLFNMDSTDTAEIKQRLSNQEVSKEKQHLNDAEKNFQNAYQKLMSIDENIELIKDADQRKQAKKLVTLMDNRKKLMESFFDTYRAQLKSQSIFFDELEQGKFELKKLEQQIHSINEDSIQLSKVVEQFNLVTEQYNTVENKYFKAAGLS